MKKTRRIILRTKMYERISLRKNSKTINRKTLGDELYKLEISIAAQNGRRIIYETEIHGLIEIEETNNEIRLVSRKK